MMIQNARKIAWDDPSEALPVFLTVVGIPLSSSIADGLALGFVSYPVVKLLGGRGREVHWLSYVIGGAAGGVLPARPKPARVKFANRGRRSLLGC